MLKKATYSLSVSSPTSLIEEFYANDASIVFLKQSLYTAMV